MVSSLINKYVFEPSYNDLKYMVRNHHYFSVNLLVQSSCSPRDSQESSSALQFKASILQFSVFFMVQLSHAYMTTGKMDMRVDHKEVWELKNWCFWAVVLEKSLESHLDSKDIKPVIPKGNQPWIFIGRTDAEAETPILWLLDAKKQLTGKDSEAGEDWGQKKWVIEDELVWWNYQLNRH